MSAYPTGTDAVSMRSEEAEVARCLSHLDQLVPEISARVSGLFPRLMKPTSDGEGEELPELLTVSRGRRDEDLAHAVRSFFPRTLRQLVNGVVEAAESEIRKLQYLGPLRSCPPRHLAFSQHQDTNWRAGGGHAWDVVRQRHDIRERINEWLGSSRLKTPYEIRVRDLVRSPR